MFNINSLLDAQVLKPSRFDRLEHKYSVNFGKCGISTSLDIYDFYKSNPHFQTPIKKMVYDVVGADIITDTDEITPDMIKDIEGRWRIKRFLKDFLLELLIYGVAYYVVDEGESRFWVYPNEFINDNNHEPRLSWGSMSNSQASEDDLEYLEKLKGFKKDQIKVMYLNEFDNSLLSWGTSFNTKYADSLMLKMYNPITSFNMLYSQLHEVAAKKGLEISTVAFPPGLGMQFHEVSTAVKELMTKANANDFKSSITLPVGSTIDIWNPEIEDFFKALDNELGIAAAILEIPKSIAFKTVVTGALGGDTTENDRIQYQSMLENMIFQNIVEPVYRVIFKIEHGIDNASFKMGNVFKPTPTELKELVKLKIDLLILGMQNNLIEPQEVAPKFSELYELLND